MKLYLLLATLIDVSSPQTAASQTLRPLPEILAGDHEVTYPLVRCAAFYLSSVEWAGSALDQQSFDQSNTATQPLVFLAAILRAKDNGMDLVEAAETAANDARFIADLYIESYRASYAASGNAWSTNELWLNDKDHCASLAGEAALQVNEFSEEE